MVNRHCGRSPAKTRMSLPIQSAEPIKRLLDVEEVAEILGVSANWVRAHAAGRRLPRLPAIKLGYSDSRGLWKFQAGDIENFIQEHRTE